MTSGVDVPEDKVLRWAEVKELAEDENKCILVINDRVYDVTKFVDEVCHSFLDLTKKTHALFFG